MKLEIEFENIAHLVKQLNGFLGLVDSFLQKDETPVNTVAELTQPKGRGRPPKEKTEPVKSDVPKPEATKPESIDIGFGEPVSTQITLDDFKKAFQVAVATKGVDHCRKVLAEFGVAKATEVPAESYARVMEKLK